MDPVSIGVTMLGHAGKYLLDNGGNDMVKKAAEDLYSWVKGKFKKPDQQEKIEKLKAAPEDKTAKEAVQSLLQGSIEFDAIDGEELENTAKSFEKAILEGHPDWLKKSGIQIKNNSIVVEGNDNIIIQDTTDSTITINKG